MFAAELPFALGVAGIKTRLDTASDVVSSAHLTLQLPVGGDVQQAIRQLKQKETQVDATCQSLANTFGIDYSENLTFVLSALRKRLNQILPFTVDQRLDEAVQVLIQRYFDSTAVISSAKKALDVDENGNDQEIHEAIQLVRGKLESATSTINALEAKIKLAINAFGLADDFTDGIESVKSRLEAAERIVAAVRNSLQISANDDLLNQVQQHVDDVSHVRDVLEISGELQAGVSAVKQRIDRLDSTILQARTSLKLVESNSELLAGIDRAKSDFNKMKEKLEASEEQVSDARTALKLSSSASLQQGIVAMQEDLNQANGIIQESRTSLELVDTDIDLSDAIGKAKSEATANEIKLAESQKEVREARTLLQLAESLSLQQGIAAVQEQLTQAKNVIKEARTSLGFIDDDLDLAGTINRVNSAAEQIKTDLAAKNKVITEAGELLALPDTSSLQDAIANLQQDLKAANETVDNARNALALQGKDADILLAISKLKQQLQDSTQTANNKQARILEVEQQLQAKSEEIDQALASLKLPEMRTLKSACSWLRDRYDTILWDYNAAKSALGITQTSGRTVENGIKGLQQRLSNITQSLNLAPGVNLETGLATRLRDLTEAQTRIDEARALLNLQGNVTLLNGIRGLQQSLSTAEDAIRKTRGSLGLQPDITLEAGLARWQQRLNAAEQSVRETRQSLALEAGITTSRGLSDFQRRLKTAEDAVEEARTSLNLQTEVTLRDGLGRAMSQSVWWQGRGYDMQQALRKLLVPGTELVEGSGDLNRYKPLGAKIRNNGTPLKTPEWFLAISDVPTTMEPFDQLTERLRALMVLDADILDQLKVLEDLMQQVARCALPGLVILLDMLFACWRSNGHITMTGDITVLPTSTPQPSLQVLFEARLLELLIRGTSVLQHGWADVDDTIQQVWQEVNRSVIDNNPVLQAYRAWFNSLSTTPINLLQELLNTVTAANEAQVCTEESEGRVLAADVMADGSHCFLWQPGQPRGSMYAVSDLQYYIPSSVIVFPGRRESGVIVTDPPFTEPVPMTFVMENMNSLVVRGSVAQYKV